MLLGGFGQSSVNSAGEEELLMHVVASSDRWSVRFCGDPAAAVTTDPAPTLGSFLHQRSRWASLSLRLPQRLILVPLLALFYFFVLLIAGTVAAPFFPALWTAVALVWGLKAAAEFAVLYPACRHFKQSHLLRHFVAAQILHPPYIVYCSLAGLLGRFRWKERTARP